jgi:methylmalonyl-CoA/ethylmalonyl-CoA epimerase
MNPALEFHHIGIACRAIEPEMKAFAALGYTLEGEQFSDPLQKIHGCFMTGMGPRIELLAPMDESSPVTPWLKKGVKMYHYGYLVDSVESTMQEYVARRAMVVSPPKPSIAFGGRPIAFLMLPNLFLIELIERSREK